MALQLTQRQNLKLEQRQVLSLQQTLEIELVQLPLIEMVQKVEDALESNPFLEDALEEGAEARQSKENDGAADAGESATPVEASQPAAAPEGEPETEAPSSLDEGERIREEFRQELFERLSEEEYFDEAEGSAELAGLGRVYDSGEEPDIEEYVAAGESLVEHLLKQLREYELTPYEEKIAEYLIGCLDRNGYFEVDLDEVRRNLGCSQEELDRCVEVIRSMDPDGIGAFDLRDCLLLQYRRREERDPLVETLIENYLDELADGRFDQIVALEGVSEERVREAYEHVRTLDPKPAAHFEHSGSIRYIEPDVMVDKINGELVVRLCEKPGGRRLPMLRIARKYERLLRDKQLDAAQIKRLREMYRRAKAFIEAYERAKQNIVNVTRKIFEVQDEFFEKGVRGLKPLVLRTVAEACGIHESTVSRITSGRDRQYRYVQTPRGVYPLKFFFSRGVETEDGGSVSTRYVKELIREIIEGEDPARPYSDEKIVKILKEKGIDRARRTVAKYREEMGIPSAARRKRRKAGRGGT